MYWLSCKSMCAYVVHYALSRERAAAPRCPYVSPDCLSDWLVIGDVEDTRLQSIAHALDERARGTGKGSSK